VTLPRPLRVACLTSARGWRGSGVSLAKIATGLAARGHHSHMFAGSEPVLRAFTDLGLPTSLVPTASTGLREAWVLRRKLTALGTEVILADRPRDLRLAVLASVGRPTSVVYRYNHSVLGAPLGLSTRLFFRRARGCIYQAERVREQALSRAPWLATRPGWVIPNGFDLARFAPDREAGQAFRARHSISPDAVLILTVAALERGKGHEVAMEALERISGSGPRVYLICGVGRRETNLRADAMRRRVPTLFVGHLETDALVGALNAADLVVHPSQEDIFPNAVGEAMACARPVIASDVGGVGELLGRDGVAGILVAPGDVAALSEAMRCLLADPSRRAAVAAAARARIEARGTLARMVDGYEAVFYETVGA
jgi:glycosyltransferase involved in cell wall biosynthesis